MSIIEELAAKTLSDDYFKELFLKAEIKCKLPQKADSLKMEDTFTTKLCINEKKQVHTWPDSRDLKGV